MNADDAGLKQRINFEKDRSVQRKSVGELPLNS